jgi:pilus assembly protein CpaB
MGLITTLLFYQYTKKLDVEKTAASKTIGVVVAKEKIAKNEVISTKKLELVNMPESAVLSQSYKSTDDVNGKIATAAIEKGEQILPNRVISESKEKVYVSRKVRDGYRAVSVGVDINQSVSNLIEPEDLVDVVFTSSQNSQPPNESTILLEKVNVLAVGQKMAASDQPNAKGEQYSSVTLELKPQDAVKLINSLGQGKIHFILYKRPASDR